jgi:hypothetical protein
VSKINVIQAIFQLDVPLQFTITNLNSQHPVKIAGQWVLFKAANSMADPKE